MAARKRKPMKVERVTQYLCVTGSGIKPDELNAEINRLITKDGFQPWGSPPALGRPGASVTGQGQVGDHRRGLARIGSSEAEEANSTDGAAPSMLDSSTAAASCPLCIHQAQRRR